MVATEPMPRATARLSESGSRSFAQASLIERHQLLHCGPKVPRSESAFSPDACCGIDHLPSHLILTQIKFIVSGDFFRVIVMVSEVAPRALAMAAPRLQ